MSEYIHTEKNKKQQKVVVGFDKKYGRLFGEIYNNEDRKPIETIGWFNSQSVRKIETVDELKEELAKRGWNGLQDRLLQRLETEQKNYEFAEQRKNETFRNAARVIAYQLERAGNAIKNLWNGTSKPEAEKEEKAAKQETKTLFPYRVQVKTLRGNQTVLLAVPSKQKSMAAGGKTVITGSPSSSSKQIVKDRHVKGKPKDFRIIDRQTFNDKQYVALKLLEGDKKTVWYHSKGIENQSNRKVLNEMRTLKVKSKIFETELKTMRPHSLITVDVLPTEKDRRFRANISPPSAITRSIQQALSSNKNMQHLQSFLKKHKDFPQVSESRHQVVQEDKKNEIQHSKERRK
jgi:hypothetical protein